MYIRSAGLRFEWDETKRAANLRKHGLDLADAVPVFAGPMLVAPDLRLEYGEDRWIGIGRSKGRTVVVAFVEQPDDRTVRIISMRKALRHERRIYEEALSNALAKDR